jgi:hypothetical protein
MHALFFVFFFFPFAASLSLTCDGQVKDGSWKADPWLRQLDWTVQEQRFTKPKLKKDGTYAKV